MEEVSAPEMVVPEVHAPSNPPPSAAKKDAGALAAGLEVSASVCSSAKKATAPPTVGGQHASVECFRAIISRIRVQEAVLASAPGIFAGLQRTGGEQLFSQVVAPLIPQP